MNSCPRYRGQSYFLAFGRASNKMHQFLITIELMDSKTFYLILALSVVWGYLLYETLESWMIGTISVPMFALSSFLAIHVMEKTKFYLAHDDTTNTIFAACVGSIIGLAITCIIARLYLANSVARLKIQRSNDA